MNFYKHYIGDFQRDTSHLSLTERGAYLSLMHHYYATENPLPPQHKALCRIAGAITKVEQDAVRVAMRFFYQVESGLIHDRIEAEIEKAGKQADTNRRIAVDREAARKKARRGVNESRDESNTKRATNREPNQTPDTKEQEPPCSPPMGDSPPAGKNRKAKAVTLAAYLSDCEAQGVEPIPAADAVWRTADAAGLPRDWVALAWWSFQGRYLANPGDKAKTYASWPQTFRNAVRENWLKLWWPVDSGGYRLSPAGVQAQREMESVA